MLSKISKITILSLASVCCILAACRKDENTGTSPAFYRYEFTSDAEGWQGGFADHPDTSTADYNLEFKWTKLPAPLNTSQPALKIGGTNRSDDLFMYLKRKITGLAPNTKYLLTYEVELASNAPTGGVGVGGSPDAVMLKAGAVLIEPNAVLNSTQGIYRMNLDHGQQMTDGKDLYNLGTIGVGPNTTQYTLISRTNKTRPFPIRTNDKGEVWAILGTDSGFEARTELYYRKIILSFQLANQ